MLDTMYGMHDLLNIHCDEIIMPVTSHWSQCPDNWIVRVPFGRRTPEIHIALHRSQCEDNWILYSPDVVRPSETIILANKDNC